MNKATPTISAAPTASAITYGQTLADSNLTGGTASTAGTYAFTTPSTAPNAGTANQGVTFSPSDTANYNTATTIVSVLVNKATPTISAAPTASAITYGQTLAASSLIGGTASTAGTFAFTTPLTAPNVGTANQGVTFTPNDTANFNTATTSASVTVIDGDLPVPGADAFTAKVAAGMTTKVTLASLLANDRPSANPSDTRNMTFVSVESTSSGGAAIRVKGGWLIYQPYQARLSAQNEPPDTFTYTVSNGTKTARGTVTVSLVAPDYVPQVAIDRVDGNKVYFSVMPGMTFEVQGSDLTAPVTWSPILNGSSNWTSGADGRLIVTDPAAGASRFYRFKWIP